MRYDSLSLLYSKISLIMKKSTVGGNAKVTYSFDRGPRLVSIWENGPIVIGFLMPLQGSYTLGYCHITIFSLRIVHVSS